MEFKTMMANVRAFHDVIARSAPQPMCCSPEPELMRLADIIVRVSKEMEKRCGDHDKRWLRAHLIAEECGEMLMDMARGNEVGALDGAADLQYVLIGTAVTLDWPLEEAFCEVHRSNMSKRRQDDDPAGDRVRQKGPHYVPPDVHGVLLTHRAAKEHAR